MPLNEALTPDVMLSIGLIAFAVFVGTFTSFAMTAFESFPNGENLTRDQIINIKRVNPPDVKSAKRFLCSSERV